MLRRSFMLVFALLALSVSACGEDEETGSRFPTSEDASVTAPEEDMGVEPDEPDMAPDLYELPDLDAPRVPTAVETRLIMSEVTAGSVVAYECLVVDQDGEPFMADDITFDVVMAPDESFMLDGDDYIAVRAGRATVQCVAPDLGLIDETPELLTIVPGAPYVTVTSVDQNVVTAGDTVTASCEVFDAYGNPIDDAAPTLSVEPDGSGVQTVMLETTIITAGVYDIACSVEGTTDEKGQRVEVQPGLPASLAISIVPNQAVFGIGDVVGVSWVVTDKYGNVVDDATVTVSSPGGTAFGLGRFRYDEEGTYDITVTVDGQTEGNAPLSRTVTVVINSEGPAIRCDYPFDGQMVNAAPGSQVSFAGAVSDVNGISTVTVNGQGVSPGATGEFQTQITGRYGINFIEVQAVDSYGVENSRTCAFLMTSHWRPESQLVDDTVTLKLKQAAIDDNSASGPIDSLDDILHRVVNSSGLVSQLRSALNSANPLRPYSCAVRDPVFGVCLYSAGVNFKSLSVNGPNTTSLTLIPSGLRTKATIRNLAVTVRVESTLIDTDVTAEVDRGTVDISLNLALSNGRPSVSVRTIHEASIGNIFLDTGLPDWLDSIVSWILESTVRNILEDELRKFIRDEFAALLDGVFENLDISSLGTSFAVPKLDGSGTTTLDFGLGFSTLNVTTARALFGVETRITARTPERATPSLGVPYPVGPVLLDPPVAGSTGVGVHVGILNSALHALWRAGFFDATIDASTLGSSFPPGAQITLSTNLPPVVENLADGNVKLMLGAMNATLLYPGIFDPGIAITLGAVATTTVQISGNDLQFGNVNINELVFSTADVSLDATTRSVVEDFLRALMQSVVDSSLNDALPALPIPGFEIPPSLGAYGLPVGDQLSIVNPLLEVEPRHYILDGNFGVR